MLKEFASTVLATVQTRLALLANEVQLEEQRLLQLAWRGLAAVLCLGLGLVLTLVLVLSLWWEQRVWLLSALSLFFFAMASYFWLRLRSSMVLADPIFSASLAELKEDLRQLKAASGHDTPTD